MSLESRVIPQYGQEKKGPIFAVWGTSGTKFDCLLPRVVGAYAVRGRRLDFASKMSETATVEKVGFDKIDLELGLSN